MTDESTSLIVTAISYESWFPGFVTCEFWDVEGIRHEIQEKVPVIGCEEIDHSTVFPVQIGIPGQVTDHIHKQGKLCLKFFTQYQIQDQDGNDMFWVAAEQIRIT